MKSFEILEEGKIFRLTLSTERNGDQKDQVFLQDARIFFRNLHPGGPGIIFFEPREGQQGNRCFCECDITCEDPRITEEIKMRIVQSKI